MNEVTDISRRGTWVIVRCFGNAPRRVRVWEENENAVWVVSDEAYRRKTSGAWVSGPYVGFRWDAVFEDDPDIFGAPQPEPGDFSWKDLKPFSPLGR